MQVLFQYFFIIYYIYNSFKKAYENIKLTYEKGTKTKKCAFFNLFYNIFNIYEFYHLSHEG